MISVNRNFGSLVGQLNLKAANSAVETAVQRLSSGARVNSAADDSAGFAVVSKMASQIKGLSNARKKTDFGWCCNADDNSRDGAKKSSD